MSTLHQSERHLAAVNYSRLFEAIGTQLKRVQREQHLLKKILWIEEKRLIFNLGALAYAIAKETKPLPQTIESDYSAGYSSVYFADDKARSKFSSDLEQHIWQPLCQMFTTICHLSNQEPAKYAHSLLQPLSSFANTGDFNLGTSKKKGNYLLYPLSEPTSVKRRRLHFQKQPGLTHETKLKGHKLTIDVQGIRDLRAHLIQGISAHLEALHESQQDDNKDKEELKEAQAILNQEEGPVAAQISRLCETITDEVLARIQRTARLHYLDYIRPGLTNDPKAGERERRAAGLLQTLIERLRQLEAYIQRYPDSHYTVSYGQTQQSINLRDLFSRADAFDPLPIFGEVVGQLGEIINEQQGLKRFIHGLRLKLNGNVHVHGGEGEPSFDFHLALLQPGKSAFEERRKEAESNGTLDAFYTRIVRVAVLYFFAFKHWEAPAYQPEKDFEQQLLPVLRGGTQEEKDAALQRLAAELEPKGSQAQGRKSTSALLQELRSVLVASLKKAGNHSRPYRTNLVVSLNSGLLNRDPEQIFIQHHIFADETLFDEAHRRELLKYISIEEARISSDVLCKLDVSLQIEPLYFLQRTEAHEETSRGYSMSYDLGQLQALPVILVPTEQDQQKKDLNRKLFQQCFGGLRHIALGYGYHYQGLATRSAEAFVYRITYILLAYLFIKLVVKSAFSQQERQEDKLFLPLICIHTRKEEAGQEHYNDESILHSITKVLEHLLGADYLTSSQGMHKQTLKAEGNDLHRLKSALCSLYSSLPHRFKPTRAPATATSPDQAQQGRLDKVAILVVSSRKCDYSTQARDDYLATIYGEVLGLERKGSDLVLRRLRTFADNHPSESMHTRPDIIIEQAHYCAQQGYRHLLYVAHAPYSRTLGLTKGGAHELFFMSQEIIQAMREAASDLRVYPIFCDLYYVLDLSPGTAKQDQESLYIDELRELADVVNDPSKRTVMFLNLYTGYKVPAGVRAGVSQERVYNGVMAYSTVTNVYDQDPSYEQYIWSDLLAPDQPGTIKHDLIEAITLLHFMRFEKPSSPMMKLDPYKRIIGDRSIGAQAIIPHMRGQCRFNMLGFLAHVRSVLSALEEKQDHPPRKERQEHPEATTHRDGRGRA
ncbi:hypothetical protein [Thermogemmatispora carboxidivorans]|uniref:hypothetical protein n=1 Tax=Thermogemmatispora carboxidivorans TaxID=1382306 RepID=UPI00069A1501|nr:hypothetical protein [Thermogemmatispora carboxidivorans]